MDEKLKETINLIEKNIDNPDFLSRVIVTLSSILYYHNAEMARAELEEKRVVVNHLMNTPTGLKRMTISEAEKRGVIETDNNYGRLKTQSDSIVEIINSVKFRLRVLSWEHGSKGGEGND